jgi:hypothetical protein
MASTSVSPAPHTTSPSSLDLRAKLSDFPAGRERWPWPGYEYVRGWGVFGLPFDSGHVLALRVFPKNDFAPYRTLRHRTPDGQWSIYVDGARLDTACPRSYGSACTRTGFARLNLEWTGPDSLCVSMDEPRLKWTLTASETPMLRVLNAASAKMPLWSWRASLLVRMREVLAKRFLHMGDIRMAGTMPSGHDGILMPERMYFIEESTAELGGVDLGRPARAVSLPRIGDVALPARGVLAIGQTPWRIRDAAEYERTRTETAVAA